jgi:hypothetical protein
MFCLSHSPLPAQSILIFYHHSIPRVAKIKLKT